MATKTGRQGNVTVDATAIAITKWTAKLDKELADATDSSGYDATTGQTWKSQAPGCVAVEGTIEGNFDSATTPARIIAKLKQDGSFPVVLKYDAATTCCSGNFDLDEVELSVEVPGATMITFSASIKSNGVVTFP